MALVRCLATRLEFKIPPLGKMPFIQTHQVRRTSLTGISPCMETQRDTTTLAAVLQRCITTHRAHTIPPWEYRLCIITARGNTTLELDTGPVIKHQAQTAFT